MLGPPNVRALYCLLFKALYLSLRKTNDRLYEIIFQGLLGNSLLQDLSSPVIGSLERGQGSNLHHQGVFFLISVFLSLFKPQVTKRYHKPIFPSSNTKRNPNQALYTFAQPHRLVHMDLEAESHSPLNHPCHSHAGWAIPPSFLPLFHHEVLDLAPIPSQNPKSTPKP